MEKRPWWQHEAAIAWAMILLFPLGVLLMWLYAPWRNRFKWMWTGITAFLALMILVGAMSGSSGNDTGKELSVGRATAEATTPTLTADQIAFVEAVSTQEAEQATASAVPAQQTRAARPTSTPVPPRYELALISASCTRKSDIGFRECEGYVKNITDEALYDVEAVVTWVDANGTPYSTDEALVDYNPILPGQESPWSTIGTDNPALTRFRVQFRELLGSAILTRDDRP
jgi:hypothetical protein